MDIDTIKKYNQRVNTLKQSVSQILAEKKIRTQELNSLCESLSKELNREVTPENIEEIYKEITQQIQDTISAGTEILTRVENELGQTPNQSIQQTQQVQQNGFNPGFGFSGVSATAQNATITNTPVLNIPVSNPQNTIGSPNNLGSNLINFGDGNILSI